MTRPLDHDVLTTLALGCRHTDRVSFDYQAMDGQRSSRRVEPHRLVPLGQRWCLVGYDLDRHAWRTFRVDEWSTPRVPGCRFRQVQLAPSGAATRRASAGALAEAGSAPTSASDGLSPASRGGPPRASGR